MTTDDIELLRRYVAERSEAAFTELVHRHINLVYSAALRQVHGDVPAAQDVTQAVFADLARKAPRLVRHTSLTGWLYTSTRYLAANARRTEQRRHAREQEAHAMNQLLQSPNPDPAWQDLQPVLDDVMHELSAADREAVLLRYFERRPLAEVGTRLGLSENAARMRVDRALDKLRASLAKRGVTSTVGALAMLVAERAVGVAPAAVAAQVSRAAFLAGVAGGGSIVSLFNLLASAKATLLVGAAVVAVAATCLLLPKHANNQAPIANAASAVATADQTMAYASPATDTRGNVPASVSAGSTSTSNKLVLRIVAADSGEPIPQATIDYFVGEGVPNAAPARVTPTQLTATDLGVCEIPVARSTARALLLESRTDGLVDTSLSWSPQRGETIPVEYTLRLARAVPIGGLVVDGDGKPVAGAEVQLSVYSFPENSSDSPHISTQAGEKVMTDAAGRWRINRFAKDAITNLGFRATHPEYFADLQVHYFGTPIAVQTQLLAGTYVFKLARSVALRGVIVDTNGQPVPGVKITADNARYYASGPLPNRPATTNQTDGTFTLAGCRAGTNMLSFEAKGFAQTNLDVDLEPDSPPLLLTLQPGKGLRLQVVDRNGVAVPKTTVSLPPGFGLRAPGSGPITLTSLFSQQTDADGRIVWDSPPDGVLLLTVAATGMKTTNVTVRPDGREHVITLTPALTISGNVRDAVTSELIPHFSMSIGSPPAVNWVTDQTNGTWNQSLDFEGGKFRHVEEGNSLGRNAMRFKFEAEGYAPFITRVVRADEGQVQLDIPLQAGTSTTVTVVLPDGTPATNADVALIMPGAQLLMVPSGLMYRPGYLPGANSRSLLSTDDQGHFALPPTEEGTRVIAAFQDGFAEATPAALAAEPMMHLQPWGRLEGTFFSGGKPAVGALLRLISIGPGTLMLYDPEVETDAEGHFAFPKVPPGRLKLMKRDASGGRPGLTTITEVALQPGEMKTMTVGAYTVTARLRWPEDLKQEGKWRVSAFCVRPPSPGQVFTQTAEGSLVAEDVSAGSYTMKVLVSDAPTSEGSGKTRARAEVPFTVPADPPGGTLDLGEIVLKPAQ